MQQVPKRIWSFRDGSKTLLRELTRVWGKDIYEDYEIDWKVKFFRPLLFGCSKAFYRFGILK